MAALQGQSNALAVLVQFVTVFVTLVAWLSWCQATSKDSEARRKYYQERVAQAAHTHEGRDLGIDGGWYAQMNDFFRRWGYVAGLGAFCGLLYAMGASYPASGFMGVTTFVQSSWERLLDLPYDDEVKLMGATLGVHLAIFWPMAIGFALLDFFHPKLLAPFKIQDGVRMPVSKYVKCGLLGLFNQGLTGCALYGIGKYLFPYTSPQGLSRELPSFMEFAVQMACCAVYSEIWFYFGHRAMHAYSFLWYHVHCIHHSVGAPSAIASTYAHPLEHLVVNMPTTAIGALVCGCHGSVYIAFSAMATFDTCMGHSGWHLPFCTPNEFHDFHHFQGVDNYGTFGILDLVCGTSKVYYTRWNSAVSKVYTNAMFPVDKVLGLSKQKERRAFEAPVKSEYFGNREGQEEFGAADAATPLLG